jgi:hypothetical protein
LQLLRRIPLRKKILFICIAISYNVSFKLKSDGSS